jgi:hypothetical protein
MDPKSLGYGLIHGMAWIECAGGILQYQLHSPAVGLQCAAGIVEWFTVYQYASLRWLLKPEKSSGECGLPAAALTHQCDDLTTPKFKVDSVDGSGLPATATTAEGDDEFTTLKGRLLRRWGR